ncbi:hypothetical protein ACFYT4_30080 [Streptomyces sp. NPDC004609]
MPPGIRADVTLDDTHRPHITLLQRSFVTADIDDAYAAIGPWPPLTPRR